MTQYTTTDLGLTSDHIQHICINDAVDIIVRKDLDNNYKVQVLSIPNSNYNVSCELIDFNEYKKVFNLD